MTRVPEHIPRIGIDEIKKCALCARGVMHDDHLHFYRASLGQGLIHLEGMRRAHSMEQFFHGHTGIARVFHDGTPVAFEVWRAKDLWICQACVHRPLYELIEAANRPDESEEPSAESGQQSDDPAEAPPDPPPPPPPGPDTFTPGCVIALLLLPLTLFGVMKAGSAESSQPTADGSPAEGGAP